jgi:hypothetical protein
MDLNIIECKRIELNIFIYPPNATAHVLISFSNYSNRI